MRLRGLDVDDLILIGLLYEGFTVTQSAKKLNITQSAASQRIKKISDFLGFKIRHGAKINNGLTLEAIALANAVRACLFAIERALPPTTGKTINDIFSEKNPAI